MSAPAATVAPKTAPVLAKTATSLLQRKCACGKGGAGVSGECESCQRDKLIGVQTKLLVGASDDPLEHEADRAAERVLGMPTPAGGTLPFTVSTLPPPASSAPAMAGRDAQSMDVPLPQESALGHGGAPLSPALRQFFETRFGRDLSDVRVHNGGQADAWNEQLNSHAFTYGSHVWLGHGHRPAANFLLAHELAHVIQQRQPRSLRQSSPVEDVPELSGTGPVLRRLELGMPFWVPLGSKGKKGGSDIHEDLLKIAQDNNADLDIEAPAPNSARGAAGLGLQGSIDLYLGKHGGKPHARVGLFFAGNRGTLGADVETTTPTKHKRANVKGIAAGDFNPFVTASGGIDGIAKGPNNVEIGELKPAAKPILEKGEQQIENYREGMKDAQRLTNQWAKNRSKTESWDLKSTGALSDSAVKFIHNGTDLKFNPGNLRDDENLVLATVSESDIGGKYKVKVRFNPVEHGLPPIKGGLYAQLHKPGKGLWTYFARPKDLAGALKLARSTLIKAEMALANQAQDEVIDPLFKAPKKITPLRRSHRPQPEAPLAVTPSLPLIRRKVKTPELKDEFDHAKWKKDQAALRAKISGPTASADTKKQMASLELLERAYEAEEALDKVDGTGKTKLPPKNDSANMVKIVSGKGTERKEHKRSLADMSSWLLGWTGKPAEVLGIFRDKFGDSFVWVANKLSNLRDRIREKYRSTFEKHPSKPSGGKGKIIAKALLKALLQVAKILIPRAAHLFMDAVVAGSKKKLAKLFDLDPVKMAEDTFGEEFTQLSDKLGKYKEDAEKYATNVIDSHTKDLAWIKDVIDTSKTIGPILEAASIAIQCGTPPGWGCLKLLARKLVDCGMEAALNVCAVQKEIAGIVSAVGPLANLPATLAQKSLDMVKDAAPEGLKDVFSEPVSTSGAFNKEDIECEDTPPEGDCPGLFSAPSAGAKGEKSEQSEPGKQGEQQGDKTQPSEPGQGEKKLDPKGSNKGAEAEKVEPDECEQGKGCTKGDKTDPNGSAPGSSSDQQGEAPGKGGPTEPDAAADGKGDKQPQPSKAPQSGATVPGADGVQGGLESLPVPDETHKALSKLFNEHGAESIEALAKLAEAAGMPDNAPMTADQVKKLQELLKKGGLSSKALQELAGGKAKPGTQRKAAPLDKFLGEEAHKAVMEQTLEKLRQKQYDITFDEMAKLKVRLKVLVAYKPGPFRNAPALMWTDQLRAAGVVDGVFGECHDGGKVHLKITRAVMYEQGTELEVRVTTPFEDANAQLASGVCPTPLPPPSKSGGGSGQGGGGGGQGNNKDQGSGSGKHEQDQQEHGEDQPEQGHGQGQSMGPGDEQVPPDQQGKSSGQGAGSAGGIGVDSRADPDHSAAPSAQGEADQGEQEEEKDEEQQDADKGKKPEDKGNGAEADGAQQGFSLDIGGLAGNCGFPPQCTQDPWLIDFEELGASGDGYQVMPGKDNDPDHTLSMTNPPNKVAPFSIRSAADGSLELVLVCEGKTCVVGIVKPSPVNPAMHELVSGPQFDLLRALLRRFIKEKRNGSKGRAERIHFF
ncbi:DUF4157 domain-containing protein [Pseudomonas sp. SO81]|uniref:eCIS core domain-containing protein n=1 Tax=Pseudomonas sp. SO81 TaxID=2983246 RepID=UPI0025A37C09|nr:DUF4157 domain-containing protein [Pseudomonas sp. SO81]